MTAGRRNQLVQFSGSILAHKLVPSLRSVVSSLMLRIREPAVEPGPLVEEPPPPEPPHPWLDSYPPELDWDIDIVPKPLPAILDDAIAAHGDSPCLEFLGKSYSYEEVGALVARAAKGFQELGVGEGVRVGLFLPNCPYYVICYYAILKAGGTVVNFNPLYAPREVRRQIRDSECRIMVTLNLKTLYAKVADQLDSTCLEKIVGCSMGGILPLRSKALFALLKRRELASIPRDGEHVKFDKLLANDGDYEPVEIDPRRDIALLQYTGGTTGIPKGAMHTHASLYANTVQTRLWAVDMKPGTEKVLAVLPFFHVFGMTGVMNVAFCSGAELILLPRFKLSEVLKTIHKQRPTAFMGVPTMYSAINTHKELDKYDLSSLTYCISGGAPLLKEVKETFERVSGCTLVEGYGLTEAGPVCTINPFAGVNKTGSTGLPVPGTTIEIVALDDPDRLLPRGERGEICVSGPQVMKGYWNNTKETYDVLRGGRLQTGDVGYIDEDGYLYIIDRIKDVIISSGFNVYPRMVEEAVMLHPAVDEVVVCGVPHRHRGEVVKAFVKRKTGTELTSSELRAFLRDNLAPFEMPKQIEFRDELPRTLIGKPSREELIAGERGRLEREIEQGAKSLKAKGNGANEP
ncbi:MAG: long-chain fatty acid--CoA ligase [Alphaproteobacteria bacterium]